jgi:prepilin-type N-terminal cleavage/methylation domain-containing protein
MKKQSWTAAAQGTCHAFTLLEMLISVVVLALLILIVTQVVNTAATVVRPANKHIDTDTQARAVLDRMALDFGRMLKRTDVDYYLKAPIGYKNPNAHGNGNSLHLKVGEQGNDQIAFFSQVPGYNSTSSSWQSPVSLVAYRVNSASTALPNYLQLQRMGKSLLWNGVNNTTTPNSPYPIVFLPGQIAAGTGPWAGPWSAAINNDNSGKSTDSDYETIGAQVFRLEYYYLLKDGSIKDIPKILCPNGPTCIPPIIWDFSQSLSANLNAFSDVEAIAVAIAVIDPASRSLLYDASNPSDPYHRLFSILSDMADFKNANGKGNAAQNVGDLENEWNAAVQSAATTGKTYDGSAFPPAAASAIRIYNRYFDLRTPAPF